MILQNSSPIRARIQWFIFLRQQARTRRQRPPHGNVDGVSIAKLPTKSTDNVRSPNWLRRISPNNTAPAWELEHSAISHSIRDMAHIETIAKCSTLPWKSISQNYTHTHKYEHQLKLLITFATMRELCRPGVVAYHFATLYPFKCTRAHAHTHALHARTCLHYTREYNLRAIGVRVHCLKHTCNYATTRDNNVTCVDFKVLNSATAASSANLKLVGPPLPPATIRSAPVSSTASRIPSICLGTRDTITFSQWLSVSNKWRVPAQWARARAAPHLNVSDLTGVSSHPYAELI